MKLLTLNRWLRYVGLVLIVTLDADGGRGPIVLSLIRFRTFTRRLAAEAVAQALASAHAFEATLAEDHAQP